MCKCCCWWWSTSSLSWWWWWRWWRWRWWWLYFIIIDHYDDEEYDDWQPLFPRKPSHELWGERWKKDSNIFRQLNKERFGTCLEELAGFEALPHIPLQMITVSADKCGQDYCNLRVKQKYQHIRRPRQTQGGARQGIILLTLVSDYYYYYYLKVAKLHIHSSSKRKKPPKSSFSMDFRSYVRHFGGAILGLLRPSEAWCFAPGRWFFPWCFPIWGPDV